MRRICMFATIAAILASAQQAPPAPAKPKDTKQKRQAPGEKAAKKKSSPGFDFPALTLFKEALLDLKGAVSVGITRQDYTRKLQALAGEELKAVDRLYRGSF
jgi:hypothetical protein